MLIHRVINNNFAVVLDGDGKEQVVMGKGICFGKKAGAEVDTEVEKKFVLADDDVRERFHRVVSEVSPECLEISEQIINMAAGRLDKKLNENIYVSLTDHIQFAVNRYREGMQMHNEMLWHIKAMYPAEFELGRVAVDLVEEKFGMRLLEDECSFIALHLVAAQINKDLPNTISITKIVKDILSIVSNHFNVMLDEDSIHYFRFLTHLRFFAQRLYDKKFHNDSEGVEDPLFKSVKASYPDAFQCARKIGVYIENKHEYLVTNEEMLYLTIHIQRLIMSED